jgi:hypothetical protein
LIARGRKMGRRPLGVGDDPVALMLADLASGGGQLDQSLERSAVAPRRP